MTTAELLTRLDGVRPRGTGRWMVRCPAHQDRTPSLSIREVDDRILLHCFGGCTPEEIVSTVGLAMHDLFTDFPSSPRQRSRPRPQKRDLIAVAFRFELAALDRRIRADHVLKATSTFPMDTLNESQLDRLMNAVAHAYADRDRAEFLETMADDFRLKALHERTERHAA